MGFRFRRSFKIAPGVRLNLNSKSTSVRIGPKGLGYTISSNGRRRVTASIPGTGISYSEVSTARGNPKPPEGEKKKGGVWPVLWVVVAIFAAIGLLNNGSTSNRNTEPTASQASTPAPAVSHPIQAPPTASRPSVANLPRTEPTPSSAPSEVRFVTASSLNIRSAPNTAGAVIGKLQNGHQVSVLDRSDGWLLIETSPGVNGWISEQYTSTNRASPSAVQPAQALLTSPAPAIDRDAIIQKIIERSIRNYSGNCPCPYNIMRSGRRCGGNSAYSKPGGRSPICFPSDVTEAMIAAFRQ